MLHYSARLDRGRAALDETLREAADWLRERQGIAEIGKGRAQVKRRLEQMRDEDAARPLTERKYRTISYDYFLRVCGEARGIALPEHLLGYLNNAGTVFYRPGLFNDQIILDQSWALEAIISTSGKSPNILVALRQAKTMKLVTAAFGGKGGGDMAGLADHLLIVPSTTTARIQEMHIALGQMLCGALEIELGLVKPDR